MENPPVSPAINVPKPNVQPKVKLGNFESIVIILWVLSGIVIYSVGETSNKSEIIKLGQQVIYGWLIVSGILLYRKVSLFGGSKIAIEQSESQDNVLSTGKKILIALLSIIFPAAVGIITTLIWRKFPGKARKANLISMIIFIIETALVNIF